MSMPAPERARPWRPAAFRSTTVPIRHQSDLGALPEPDFMWRSGGTRITAWGTAAEIPVAGEDRLGYAAAAGAALLARIHTDAPAPAARPLLLGALSFCARATSRLVVPARVVRQVEGDPQPWLTTVSPIAGAHPGRRPPSRRPATGHHPGRPPGHVDLAHPQDPRWWGDAVRTILREIDSGTIRKALLARQSILETGHRWRLRELFGRFDERFPDSYVYAARLPDRSLFAGAIPELLVARAGTRVTSHPLAGTAPIGPTEETRRAAHRYLTSSLKIRAEHQYVVADIVQRLADLGGDVAPHRSAVVTLPTLLHLGTALSATFAAAAPDALALVAALHPTPAVGGVPRPAALALVERLEPFVRGYFAGPVGWIDSAGDGEWTLGLRSAAVAGDRVRLCAGAGIVAGSDPHEEWEETAAKLASVASVFTGA